MSKTSLYVGDLHPKVDDEDLYEAFRHIGKIVSVKVCPSGDGDALGYGFVNFERKSDAKKALERLNLKRLFGRPMRISWLKRGWNEKAERESGTNGNLAVNGITPDDDEENDEGEHPYYETTIFVKNFAELLDDDKLRRIFEPFGAIRDCCVALDSEGVSKGFGFVEFDTADAAEMAVRRMDGELIPGIVNSERRLSVCLAKTMEQGNAQIVEEIAQKGTQQLAEISSKKVFSVFVTNFGDSLNNRRLFKLFDKFGPIYDAVVVRDAKGTSKGFGFVEFEREGDAENAIRTMAGTPAPGFPEAIKLKVIRGENKWGTPICQFPPAAAQNRVQRLAEFSKKVYSVFVANFGAALDNCGLYKLFEKFGPISNSMVMMSAKGSKGCGFVEFERECDAENAIWTMAGTPVPGLPAAIKLTVKRSENKWGVPKSGHFVQFAEEIAKKRTNGLREASNKVGYQLYVGNFGGALDDRGLYEMFKKFGPIISSMVVNARGGSLGYGFVVFERKIDAENAIRAMAWTPVPGRRATRKLFVSRYEKQWGPPPSISAGGNAAQLLSSSQQPPTVFAAPRRFTVPPPPSFNPFGPPPATNTVQKQEEEKNFVSPQRRHSPSKKKQCVGGLARSGNKVAEHSLAVVL